MTRCSLWRWTCGGGERDTHLHAASDHHLGLLESAGVDASVSLEPHAKLESHISSTSLIPRTLKPIALLVALVHTIVYTPAVMFDWDEHNIEHVAEHDFDPDSVEDAFYNRNVPAPAYNVPGEKRYALIGATDAGRIVYVVYVRRKDKIRVVTARDATLSEKRRYRR